MSYTEAFTGCWGHKATGFNSVCHDCLIHTVGKLCEMLDEKEREQNTLPVHTPTIPEPTDVYEYTIGAYIVESHVQLTDRELHRCISDYEAAGIPYMNEVYRIRRMTDPKWEESL